MVWIFRSERFKIKVQYWHKNNNTSSILTKQLCPLKITWPKKVHTYKSYSLVMLHFRHTRMLLSCTTPMRSQAIVSYFSNLKLFSTFTQYMSVSHGYSTIDGIEYNDGVMWRRQKRRKSHINEANQWAMEMPIDWC